MSGQFSGLYFAVQSAKFKSLFQPRDVINIILTLFSHFFSDHVLFWNILLFQNLLPLPNSTLVFLGGSLNDKWVEIAGL